MTDEVNGISFTNKVFITTLRALEQGIPLIIHQGGTFSGKTFNILLAFLYFFNNHKTENWRLSIIGSSFPSLRRGAWKDFNTIISKIPSYITHKQDGIFTYRVGGNTVEFFSASDNKDAIEKVTQGKREYALLDECNLMDWGPADLVIGKSTKATVLAYNPHAEFWLHEKIFPYWKASDYLFKITTFLDNRHVDENTKRWLELKKLNDPEGYRVLAEGKLGQGKGMIFTNVKWVPELPPLKELKPIYGLDFGYTNDVSAMAMMGKYQGELWGRQIFYEQNYGKKEIIEAMYDSQITETDLIICDRDFTLQKEIKAAGFNIQIAEKPPGSVIQGIERLKDWTINLHVDSVDWKAEQIGYRYKERNGKTLNEPIDNSNKDHLWDCARYISTKLLNNVRPFKRKYKVA